MLSYVIVGSGYRAEYFGRIAARCPHLFQALFLCRSREKAEKVTKNTGISAVTSPEEAARFSPDFFVIAVDRDHMADTAEEWIQRGFPVVTETPVGAGMEQLERLWKLQQEKRAKIVCCEQYHRYPLLRQGLDAVSRGVIGDPSSCYLSLAHDYHGFSLIRRMLLSQGESYTIRGTRLKRPVTLTDSRYDAIWDGSMGDEARDILHVSFESGKQAIYDFSSIQYRTFIRSRHVMVRGSRGEWSDCEISYTDPENQPRRMPLMPDIPPEYRCLDNQTLKETRKTWKSELFLDTIQDEFAIASILLDMEKYLSGGPSPYPLSEALEDALFWLLMQKAVENPWQEISRPKTIWDAGAVR